MPKTRDQIFKKIMAQAILRGLESEREGEIMFVRYPEPQSPKEDNLHKQSIRSLVMREGEGDWKIHIASRGEEGFQVEVRPQPNREIVPATEPGPVTAGEEIDIENPQRIRELAEQLGNIAQELAKLSAVVLAGTQVLG